MKLTKSFMNCHKLAKYNRNWLPWAQKLSEIARISDEDTAAAAEERKEEESSREEE
jgi:hypothetical protein